MHGAWLVAQFREVVELLGGEAWLEEVHLWGIQALRFIDRWTLPVPSLPFNSTEVRASGCHMLPLPQNHLWPHLPSRMDLGQNKPLLPQVIACVCWGGGWGGVAVFAPRITKVDNVVVCSCCCSNAL